MRTAVLLLLLTAAGACGAAPVPTQTPLPGIVTGSVVIAPCRPVERIGDPPCPPRPGIPVHFQPVAGGAVVTTQTDASGTYSVQLPAGDYDARAEGGMRAGEPHRLSVTAGATITLNFAVDSGIR